MILPVAYLAGVGLAAVGPEIFPLHLERFALLPLFVVANLGEEIGWRGYALPTLQQHVSPLTSSLIVDVAWAAFHWAALARNPTQPWGYLAVGSLSLIAMSVVMTWLFNRTGGSVVLMVLVHAMYDVVVIGVVPLGETTVPLLAFALSSVVLCLEGVIVLLLAGPQLGKPRLVAASGTGGGVAAGGRDAGGGQRRSQSI